MPNNNSVDNTEMGNKNKNEEDNKKITLFIHKDSKPCQNLIDLIKNHSKKFNIDMVDIAEVNSNQIPNEIKSLPALVVNSGSELKKKKKVFDYFQNLDIEYVDLNSQARNLGYSFEAFGDIDNSNVQTNSIFSSINEKDMSFGIPEYNDNNSNGEIDLSKIQEERENQITK